MFQRNPKLIQESAVINGKTHEREGNHQAKTVLSEFQLSELIAWFLSSGVWIVCLAF